jgi:hypothetical protein
MPDNRGICIGRTRRCESSFALRRVSARSTRVGWSTAMKARLDDSAESRIVPKRPALSQVNASFQYGVLGKVVARRQ